jgi:hypothetical protein
MKFLRGTVGRNRIVLVIHILGESSIWRKHRAELREAD